MLCKYLTLAVWIIPILHKHPNAFKSHYMFVLITFLYALKYHLRLTTLYCTD